MCTIAYIPFASSVKRDSNARVQVVRSGTPLQNAGGRANLDSLQTELSAHSDLLECVLQFWTVHSFPRSHDPGPAMSNAVHSEGNNVGVLFPAVLFAHRQHDRRGFQENVSGDGAGLRSCKRS